MYRAIAKNKRTTVIIIACYAAIVIGLGVWASIALSSPWPAIIIIGLIFFTSIPVPVTMVSTCIQAIDAVNAGDPNELVTLPVGVSWKGEIEAPAWAIVEAHHLNAWIAGGGF